MFGFAQRSARCVPGAAAVLVLALMPSALAAVVDFEAFAGPPYGLGPQSYYNGADAAGGFTTQGVHFNNSYTDWGYGIYSWAGFAVSNVVDAATPGFGNQYAAWPGAGAGGSAFYAVGYVSAFDPLPVITLPAGVSVQSLKVTNTTYAGLAMRDGDGPADKFGGPTGADPDWCKLTITGLDAAGVAFDAVEFYLADFRAADSAADYIVNAWTTVDLAPLAAARQLRFTVDSSDIGPFGIDTPTYFALDNLVLAPEPTAFVLLLVSFLSCKTAKTRRSATGAKGGV